MANLPLKWSDFDVLCKMPVTRATVAYQKDAPGVLPVSRSFLNHCEFSLFSDQAEL